MMLLWEAENFKATDMLYDLIRKGQVTGYNPEDVEDVFVADDGEEVVLYRILKNINDKYEIEKGKWVLESERFHKYDLCEFIKKLRGENIDLTSAAAQESYLHDFSQNRLSEYILLMDDDNGMETWAHKCFDSHKECLEALSAGEVD